VEGCGISDGIGLSPVGPVRGVALGYCGLVTAEQSLYRRLTVARVGPTVMYVQVAARSISGGYCGACCGAVDVATG